MKSDIDKLLALYVTYLPIPLVLLTEQDGSQNVYIAPEAFKVASDEFEDEIDFWQDALPGHLKGKLESVWHIPASLAKLCHAYSTSLVYVAIRSKSVSHQRRATVCCRKPECRDNRLVPIFGNPTELVRFYCWISNYQIYLFLFPRSLGSSRATIEVLMAGITRWETSRYKLTLSPTP